jgi:GT2 family glycosyltransferase
MTTVTVGVPVFRGAAFVGEALASLRAQSHADLEVLISLDGHDEASAAACAPFVEQDERFRLVTQPERLGWAANISRLMAEARTPFFFHLPQDDVLDARYVEILLAHALADPGAAVVYADMEAFGTWSSTLVAPTVSGGPLARQLALLVEHIAAVGFRGLVRAEAMREAGPVPRNPMGDFTSDLTWLAAAARWGDLVRVPQVLYRKRYHDTNEHTSWRTWPLEDRVRAWAHHCAGMLREALAAHATPNEQRLIWLAAVHRLTAPQLAGTYLPLGSELPDLRAAFLEAIEPLDVPARLGADRESLLAWAGATGWPGPGATSTRASPSR